MNNLNEQIKLHKDWLLDNTKDKRLNKHIIFELIDREQNESN